MHHITRVLDPLCIPIHAICGGSGQSKRAVAFGDDALGSLDQTRTQPQDLGVGEVSMCVCVCVCVWKCSCTCRSGGGLCVRIWMIGRVGIWIYMYLCVGVSE